MKVLLIALFGAVVLGATFWLGVIAAGLARTRESLREAGFTKGSAKNYRRAINLLNRMTRITELDGAFAEDVLSEPTKKEIGEILADYRKQVNKA